VLRRMREELMVKSFVEKQTKRYRRSDIGRHLGEATIFLGAGVSTTRPTHP
jgi:hypothetical protein